MSNKKLKRVSILTSMYGYQIEKFLKEYPDKRNYFLTTLEEFSENKNKVLKSCANFLV